MRREDGKGNTKCTQGYAVLDPASELCACEHTPHVCARSWRDSQDSESCCQKNQPLVPQPVAPQLSPAASAGEPAHVGCSSPLSGAFLARPLRQAPRSRDDCP